MAVNRGTDLAQGFERVYHDVDAGGNCRAPWCTFSTKVEGSRHVNVDQVLSEPGETNIFKQKDRLADGRNQKAGVLSREHRKALDQLGTIVEFIYDTLPLRANAIDPTGEMETANLTIAVMEQMRRDLLEATSDKAEWMTDKNEPAMCKHEGDEAEPMCNLKRHEGDPMWPQARRERTSSELYTLLLNMLFSGVDVAMKDLQTYIERHVSSVDALVRTSMQLEQSSVYEFLTWLRDDFTDSFRVSQKADELLKELMG